MIIGVMQRIHLIQKHGNYCIASMRFINLTVMIVHSAKVSKLFNFKIMWQKNIGNIIPAALIHKASAILLTGATIGAPLVS